MRQRSMAPIKEQMKTPEKELNKVEVSNLSYALNIRMLKELNEDLNSVKKIQSEMKEEQFTGKEQ